MSDGPTFVMFDPVAAWRGLSDADRERIGAAALAKVAANDACDYIDEESGHNEAAWVAATRVFEEAVIQTGVLRGDPGTMMVPDLNAIGIAQCRVCRCTVEHACEGGCHWVRPGLCSACFAIGCR